MVTGQIRPATRLVQREWLGRFAGAGRGSLHGRRVRWLAVRGGGAGPCACGPASGRAGRVAARGGASSGRSPIAPTPGCCGSCCARSPCPSRRCHPPRCWRCVPWVGGTRRWWTSVAPGSSAAIDRCQKRRKPFPIPAGNGRGAGLRRRPARGDGPTRAAGFVAAGVHPARELPQGQRPLPRPAAGAGLAARPEPVRLRTARPLPHARLGRRPAAFGRGGVGHGPRQAAVPQPPGHGRVLDRDRPAGPGQPGGAPVPGVAPGARPAGVGTGKPPPGRRAVPAPRRPPRQRRHQARAPSVTSSRSSVPHRPRRHRSSRKRSPWAWRSPSARRKSKSPPGGHRCRSRTRPAPASSGRPRARDPRRHPVQEQVSPVVPQPAPVAAPPLGIQRPGAPRDGLGRGAAAQDRRQDVADLAGRAAAQRGRAEPPVHVGLAALAAAPNLGGRQLLTRPRPPALQPAQRVTKERGAPPVRQPRRTSVRRERPSPSRARSSASRLRSRIRFANARVSAPMSPHRVCSSLTSWHRSALVGLVRASTLAMGVSLLRPSLADTPFLVPLKIH